MEIILWYGDRDRIPKAHLSVAVLMLLSFFFVLSGCATSSNELTRSKARSIIANNTSEGVYRLTVYLEWEWDNSNYSSTALRNALNTLARENYIKDYKIKRHDILRKTWIYIDGITAKGNNSLDYASGVSFLAPFLTIKVCQKEIEIYKMRINEDNGTAEVVYAWACDNYTNTFNIFKSVIQKVLTPESTPANPSIVTAKEGELEKFLKSDKHSDLRKNEVRFKRYDTGWRLSNN